jgi:hypothetical protein
MVYLTAYNNNNNNNVDVKYLAIIGPKLSVPPGDPDYRGIIVLRLAGPLDN